jgi:hypothetical protein
MESKVRIHQQQAQQQHKRQLEQQKTPTTACSQYQGHQRRDSSHSRNSRDIENRKNYSYRRGDSNTRDTGTSGDANCRDAGTDGTLLTEGMLTA